MSLASIARLQSKNKWPNDSSTCSTKFVLIYSYTCIIILVYRQEKATYLCTELSSLCWITTVLEGLFGEYHSSSAALGQQRQEITKQPLYVIGW